MEDELLRNLPKSPPTSVPLPIEAFAFSGRRDELDRQTILFRPFEALALVLLYPSKFVRRYVVGAPIWRLQGRVLCRQEIFGSVTGEQGGGVRLVGGQTVRNGRAPGGEEGGLGGGLDSKTITLLLVETQV